MTVEAVTFRHALDGNAAVVRAIKHLFGEAKQIMNCPSGRNRRLAKILSQSLSKEAVRI